MDTEFFKLKIKFLGIKTVAIRVHPCQKKLPPKKLPKKKKKYESNAEIGTGTWGWSQRTDIQPMVQALPQRARQDGLEAPNEADAA